ncbi:RxLR effector protein [Phytophthora megakarya]|uniref:RxLR effector protein n=1 Tax=Phytophthora megakarya TaxID=4795 RepID=A0A225W480_9STRA|nr:RxLR effector protein [Phytophthora megakarya]
MRLSYTLLLVAATTLLASGSMVTVSDNPVEVSTMTAPDLVATGLSSGEKRFLRYDAEDEKGNDKEEERAGGANMFDAKKIEEMASGTKVAKRFWRWAKHYTPGKLPDVVKGELRDKYHYWYYHVRTKVDFQ